MRFSFRSFERSLQRLAVTRTTKKAMFGVSLELSELSTCDLKDFSRANNYSITTDSVSRNGRWEGTLFPVNSTKIVA